MTMRADIHSLRMLTDFVTSYQWFLRFDSFPSGNEFETTEDDMNIRCISSTIPTFKDQPIPTDIRGHKVWQPGIHQYTQNITLTMAENIDMMINNFIVGWREACRKTGTGVHMMKDEVEANITLVRLNRQDEPIWYYHLVGCFLAGYEQGELGTENTLFRPTLLINYDYFTDGPGDSPREADTVSAGGSAL